MSCKVAPVKPERMVRDTRSCGAGREKAVMNKLRSTWLPRSRLAAVLATLVLLLATCSAGTAPSASPPPTPTPTLWPTIDYVAFDALAATCLSRLPIGHEFIGYDHDRPALVPGYDTVTLVPVNFWNLDYEQVPMPASIRGLWGSGIPDEQYEPGFGAIGRPPSGGAEVLLCVSFRVADKAGYRGTTVDYAVADQGLWAVDATSAEIIEEPWMTRAGEMPEVLSQFAGLDVGGYRLLGAGRAVAARDAVLLLRGALPTPSPSPTGD